MPELPDAMHGSGAVQTGFTMIPNAVMLNGNLSPTARLVYGYFKNLAWGNNGKPMLDPPRQIIARDLSLSDSMVTACVKELTQEGLLESVRRGQGKTNCYVIIEPPDPVDPSKTPRSRKRKTDFQESGSDAFPARARSSSGLRSKGQSKPPVVPLPAVWLDEGANLPFDALAHVCQIDPADQRLAAQIATALNGRGRGAKHVKGIRELYWLECQRVAEQHGERGRTELEAIDPEKFARLLAQKIPNKEAALAAAQPWRDRPFAPAFIQTHWLSIELRSPSARPAPGPSSEDIASWPDPE